MKVDRTQRGGEQYLALQALARATGQVFDQMAMLYGLEGFLRRLAASDDREAFVLKGGVLLAAYDARRPTRDADLLALELDNDRSVIEARISSIAAIDMPDGLVLDGSSIVSQVIRDEDQYSGIRVKLTYILATMTIRIGVDVNVGDPVFPEPQDIEIPGLLTDGITLRGYPLHVVIAEKSVTGMQRGLANTRWRDWADLWTLSHRHEFNAAELQSAIQSVAEHREVAVTAIAALARDYPALAQSRWAAWRRRPDVVAGLPEDFATLLDDVVAFIDPVTEGLASTATWSPISREWQPPR